MILAVGTWRTRYGTYPVSKVETTNCVRTNFKCLHTIVHGMYVPRVGEPIRDHRISSQQKALNEHVCFDGKDIGWEYRQHGSSGLWLESGERSEGLSVCALENKFSHAVDGEFGCR